MGPSQAGPEQPDCAARSHSESRAHPLRTHLLRSGEWANNSALSTVSSTSMEVRHCCCPPALQAEHVAFCVSASDVCCCRALIIGSAPFLAVQEFTLCLSRHNTLLWWVCIPPVFVQPVWGLDMRTQALLQQAGHHR